MKTEALKKIDGDFDVLYQYFALQQADFGKTMDAAVLATATNSATTSMADVLAHVPNLTISVPVNIDKWDATASTLYSERV